MGCSCASGKNVGHPNPVIRDLDRDLDRSPVRSAILPPPSLQYLVQCNHCGARLELCVPPDTAPGIRIETSCAGCHRLLQVRLGQPRGPRRNTAESVPASPNLLSREGRGLRGRGEFGDMGEKALKETIEQARRANLVNDLPREKYCPLRHKDLTECEFCLQDYVAGDELMRLPCMHCFHSQCVAPWLRKAGTCPLCQIDACQALS